MRVYELKSCYFFPAIQVYEDVFLVESALDLIFSHFELF